MFQTTRHWVKSTRNNGPSVATTVMILMGVGLPKEGENIIRVIRFLKKHRSINLIRLNITLELCRF